MTFMAGVPGPGKLIVHCVLFQQFYIGYPAGVITVSV